MIKTIIFFHHSFSSDSSIPKNILLNAQALAEVYRFRVIVITQELSDETAARLRQSLEFIKIGGPQFGTVSWYFYLPILIWKIFRFLSVQRQEFLLFPQTYPMQWIAFLYKAFHPEVPCVWHCHHYRYVSPLKFFRKWEKTMGTLADFVIANSFSAIPFLKDNFQLSESQIKVIYPGTNFYDFPARSIDSENKIFQALMIGHFHSLQSIKIILNILSDFQKTKPDVLENFKLKIIGGGELLNYVVAQSIFLDLKKYVEFGQNLKESDVYQEMLKSSLLISNYSADSVNQAIIEALAIRLPVLADEHGGAAEIIKTVGGGYLIRYEQEKAWKAFFEQLLEKRDLSLFPNFIAFSEEQRKLLSVKNSSEQIKQYIEWLVGFRLMQKKKRSSDIDL